MKKRTSRKIKSTLISAGALVIFCGLIVACGDRAEDVQKAEQIDNEIYEHASEIVASESGEKTTKETVIDEITSEVTTETTTEAEPETTTAETIEETTYPENLISATDEQVEDFEYSGVIYYNGWKFTWYSENVLPGDGLNIPGRWSDGYFVRDEDGYICCASSDLDFGTVIESPFGLAKVYDCGCDSGVIDLYTSF